jgi:hypothetical protein
MEAKYIAPLPGETQGVSLNEINSVSYKYFGYTSSIIEFKQFTENDGYKLADEFEMKILANLDAKRVDYVTDVSMVSQKDRERLLSEKFEIVVKKFYSFNTYKEASLFSDKLLK